MKKMLVAFLLLTVLAIPAFAEGDFRFGVSLDVASSAEISLLGGLLGSAGWDLNPGFSFCAIFAPYVTDNHAVRLGGGVSFWVPRQDEFNDGDTYRTFAFYATCFLYPLRYGGNLYFRFNLGYNIPSIGDEDSSLDLKGGGHWGYGLGVDFSSNLFLEIMYGSYSWSFRDSDYGLTLGGKFTTLHLTLGFKF
jgi:hypothetical protein